VILFEPIRDCEDCGRTVNWSVNERCPTCSITRPADCHAPDRTPETIACENCGATALRTTWGPGSRTDYRCTACPAGGHIGHDGSRHGPVFEEVRSYGLDGPREDRPLLEDGAGVEIRCEDCDTEGTVDDEDIAEDLVELHKESKGCEDVGIVGREA
jgi:hypothetical protein